MQYQHDRYENPPYMYDNPQKKQGNNHYRGQPAQHQHDFMMYDNPQKRQGNNQRRMMGGQYQGGPGDAQNQGAPGYAQNQHPVYGQQQVNLPQTLGVQYPGGYGQHQGIPSVDELEQEIRMMVGKFFHFNFRFKHFLVQ